MLWAREGQAEALGAYEDAVLALIEEHDGRVVQRARSDGAEGRPDEVQFYQFDSAAAMESYLADPRRIALSEARDAAIGRTDLFPVRFL
jgi:Domain of unknown function (DUF1330)